MASPFVPDDATLLRLLRATKTIAVVGLSDNPMRPSHGVGAYLHEVGYTVVPVNPNLKELWGLKAFPDLASVRAAGIRVDMVDVFRDPAHVEPIAREAVEIGARSLWLQEGVVNERAAEFARRAGLEVVMDRCVMKEHGRLLR